MSYPQHQLPPQQYGVGQQSGQAPHYPQPPQMQPLQQQQHYNAQNNAGGVRIKTEPGLESSAPQVQSYGGMPGANATAAQRAAQNLVNQYGPRAQASINAMNIGMPQQSQAQQYQQPPQMQQQQPQARPGPPIPRPSMTPSQYQQAMAQQAAQQKAALQQTNPTAQYPQTYAQQGQQQAQQQNQGPLQAQNQQPQSQYPGQNHPSNQNQNQNPNGNQNQGGNNSGAANGIVKAQVDGGAESDDEDRHAHYGVVKTKGPDGQIIESQVEIDGMLRRQIAARGKAMEGGGLMVEMKEHNKRAAERQADKKRGVADKRQRKAKIGGAAQMDAADDSDEDKIKEEDEDAINSDLDDPDEPVDDEDDDEETQWVMLCMYDKVQRVKNKWYVFPFRFFSLIH